MSRIPTNGPRPARRLLREKKNQKKQCLPNNVPPSFNGQDIFSLEITSPYPSVDDGSDSAWKNKLWALMLDVVSKNCRVPLGDELLNQLHLAQRREEIKAISVVFFLLTYLFIFQCGGKTTCDCWAGNR